MAIQNISKYIQINDFLLLEYEFNRDGTELDISQMGATIATTDLGTKQYFNNNKTYSLGSTNNILELNSTPTEVTRSNWFNNYDNTANFYDYFDTYDNTIASLPNSNSYEHDTIKVHIVSGYNFDDVAGFILQVRALDTSSNLVDLSNFTYIKQPDILGSAKVLKFSSNTLFLGNRFYDKYVEFKIPSIYALGVDTGGGYDSSLGQLLSISPLSDVYLNYSTLPTVQQNYSTDDNTFNLVENLNFQLPVTSVADSFNIFIAESTYGDFIEYYATWNDDIIGQYMGDIESGRIALYTSNNPNDNYEEFSDTYGTDAAKWILNHEIYVYEDLGGQSSLLTQKIAFTQDSNYNEANYFRPILKYSDIDATFSIQYICRLINRMDGTQIIRRASFSSTNPKKYGLELTRINVDNIIPYKVFNRIDGEKANIIEGSIVPKTKYVKVFYETTNVTYNQNNEIYSQGTGPLLLRKGDSLYKFKFEKYNSVSNQRENSDLSGAYNYAILFILDDETRIEIGPTYSSNMNTTIGDLEFKISSDQSLKLLKQTNNDYSIIVKNPDGSNYTFYEGKYYSYTKRQEIVEEQRNYVSEISGLNQKIVDLEIVNKKLNSQIDELKVKIGDLTISNNNTGAINIVGPPNNTPYKLPERDIKIINERIKVLEDENKELTEEKVELTKQITSTETTREPSKEKVLTKSQKTLYYSTRDPRQL